MYKLRLLKQALKDLKKVSRKAKDVIVNQSFAEIAADPSQRGERLRWDLRDCWKCRVSIEGISYRIAYQFDESAKVVLIIAIGTRENFYEKLKRRVGR